MVSHPDQDPPNDDAATAADGGSLFAIPSGDDPDCRHDVVGELGSDGANRFFRCRDCASVLVREGYAPQYDGRGSDLGSMDTRLGDLLEDIEAYHDGEPTSYTAGTSPSVLDRLVGTWRRLFGRS